MKNESQALASAADLRAQLGFITEKQLFDLLNIAPGTGQNRQSAGTLPAHYKVGREKFYKLTEVEAWIKRRRVARTQPKSKAALPDALTGAA